MPLKVSVGLSKKIGLPDYGSLGASVHVEYEADNALLQSDLDAFHRQVKSAFVACKQAVQDELTRHQTSEQSNGTQNGSSQYNERATGEATCQGSRWLIPITPDSCGVPGLSARISALTERKKSRISGGSVGVCSSLPISQAAMTSSAPASRTVVMSWRRKLRYAPRQSRW